MSDDLEVINNCDVDSVIIELECSWHRFELLDRRRLPAPAGLPVERIQGTKIEISDEFRRSRVFRVLCDKGQREIRGPLTQPHESLALIDSVAAAAAESVCYQVPVAVGRPAVGTQCFSCRNKTSPAYVYGAF